MKDCADADVKLFAEGRVSFTGTAGDKAYALELDLYGGIKPDESRTDKRSGGVALQCETFGAPHLRASLKRFFARDDQDDAGSALSLGYRCALELRTSIECEKATLLGAGQGDEGEAEGWSRCSPRSR